MRLVPAPTAYCGFIPDCLFDLRIRILTAFYGGGPQAGVCDPLTPFRGTAIRGQLRFWWRATRGAAYADWQKMATEEAKIWGATEQRSPVEIRVVESTLPRPVPTVRKQDGRTVREEPGYALFPAREAKEKEKRWIWPGGEFRLQVVGEPRLKHDVEAALWAWLTFGGIGARTRRGVGALFCDDPAFRPSGNIAEWLADRSAQYITAGAPKQARSWPVLPGGKLLVGSQPLSARQSWKKCIDFWQEFRQGKPPGDRRRSPRPEGDSIRRLRRQHFVDSARPSHSHAPRLPDGYPRSVLGMPIVLAFRKEQSGMSRDQEPEANIIEPAGEDIVRMASPVIVKPLGVSEQNAVPLVLLLNTQAEENTRQVRVEWANNERRSQYPGRPQSRGSSTLLQQVIPRAHRKLGGQVIDL